MDKENQHRLLRRQIRKFNVPETFLNQFPEFISSINESYISFDKDVGQLENVLEISSKELYVSNQALKEDNIIKSKEAIEAKKHLDRVMDNVTDVIFEVNAKGDFIFINSAWESFGEEKPSDGLGRNYMHYAASIKYFDAEILKGINDRDIDDFKTVFGRLNKKGQLKWWEMSVTLQKDSNKVIQGAIGSLLDVTKTKETENQLILANEAKTNFLSTMSHEIRTPLNAVIAISNILLMNEPKPDQLKNLDALKFSSQHLLHLINDILDYNKLITGNLRFNNEPFDLRETVKGIVNSFEFTAADKGVDLIVDIKECVPNWIKGDSVRFSQVLTNLLGNAVKFTLEGSVKVDIKCIENNQDDLTLRVRIEDSGIGIAADKLDTIFDKFTQAESNTTKKFGGTGLGLAICKKILNLQKSEVFVESTLGEGTSFWFDLELDQVSVDFLESIKPIKQKDLNLKRLKLLVVDDNAMNLLVISQFFDKWNVEYDEAKNGKEAVTKVYDDHYDVILMDLQMPVMDGYKASIEIRKMSGDKGRTPIIALSASVSNDVVVKVTEAGMDDYLSKPFDPIDLYKKIEKYSYAEGLSSSIVPQVLETHS